MMKKGIVISLLLIVIGLLILLAYDSGKVHRGNGFAVENDFGRFSSCGSADAESSANQGISFRGSVKSLSIHGSRSEWYDSFGELITEFGENDWPSEPAVYAIRLDNMKGRLIFQNDISLCSVQQLLKGIKADDGKLTFKAVNEDNIYVYDWELSKVGERAVMIFGDVSPLTFERMEPLTYSLEGYMPADYTLETYAQYKPGKESGDSIILRFSEPMNTKATKTYPRGKWLDNRRLLIPIDPAAEGQTIELTDILSMRGNRPPIGMGDFASLLLKKSDAVWYDRTTHTPAGWSAYDSFYDQLIFSPDKSRYVGLIELKSKYEGLADPSYSIFVEKKGADTKLLNQKIVYTYKDGLPVQWLDNVRLLVTDQNELYIYDTDLGKRTLIPTLTSREREIGGWIGGYGYDSYQKVIYAALPQCWQGDVLARKCPVKVKLISIEGTLLRQQKHLFTMDYTDWENHKTRLQPFTNPLGLFWNGSRAGVQTVTWQNPKGGEQTVKGQWIAGDAGGVYVLQVNKDTGRSSEYLRWIPGEQPQPLPSPDGKAWGTIFSLGDRLLSRSLGNIPETQIFDNASWSWKIASSEVLEKLAPNQPVDRYYRMMPTPNSAGE